jgi:hypothetical protein
MKRYSLILCLVLIVSLSGVASAQIVLGPPPAAFGTVLSFYLTTIGGTQNTSYMSTFTSLSVGGFASNGIGFSAYVAAHGAFEFYFGTATFPTTMTANNFTARLDGLWVTYSFATGAMNAMNVDLFDMGDGTEDGVIDANDFNNTRGSRIARRKHNFGGSPADFNDINVTNAVRNDLFGAGQTNFSGFILKPNLNNQIRTVGYATTTPTLTINPGVSPGGGGGGSSGGGCFIVTAAR